MNNTDLPFAPAADRNKAPILEVLREVFADLHHVLEIGSGTGQHARYFSAAMPWLRWQATETEHAFAHLEVGCRAEPHQNLAPPQVLNIGRDTWPDKVDAVFSANTAHIMPWQTTLAMFAMAATALDPGGRFALYGPFIFSDRATAASNLAFDETLRHDDPDRGLRHFDALNTEALRQGLKILELYDMPANNTLIVWQRFAEVNHDNNGR